MGPLAGIKVIEFAGIGPGPMAAMMLADHGATVLRIDRKVPVALANPRPLKYNVMLRNRQSIALDLKNPHAVELVLRLVEQSDALIEGFRPGVTERMGLGPDTCLARNPRLVYGRITGWGQTGPLAHAAGHDLNYIALTGALNAIGRHGQAPTPPLNILGDYAGGALYLVFGMLAAILSARNTGTGQIVDAAIVDGTTSLMTSFYGMHSGGLWNPERGTNRTDSGMYFYDVYQCADGKWISIASMEKKFYEELLRRLEIDPAAVGAQTDQSMWPKARGVFAEKFKLQSRQHWCDLLEGTDACFAPVLSLDEAPLHPHMQARGIFVEVNGVVQPAPAPRFSVTPSETPKAQEEITSDSTAAQLAQWLSAEELQIWKAKGLLD